MVRSPEYRFVVAPPSDSRSMPVTVARTWQKASVGASVNSTATLPVVGAAGSWPEESPEPPHAASSSVVAATVSVDAVDPRARGRWRVMHGSLQAYVRVVMTI